ncbi:hypothetical protein CPLU01_09220 [Colletotrichum plurivorum]|uniref:Uncharacterized protein n=1 Tax=Colletotrichum plurivorum TaxID=2175906 RepID=A0A8H6K9G2_9PEZI|nr:hypothetical protein CPLU01_09220 [Colletotrichum plurivorum]
MCPTFPMNACLQLSTVFSRCDCPTVAPTTTVNYPCNGPAPGGCMGTSYIYETTTRSCINAPILPTPPVPTPLPTQCPTVYTTGTVCGTCIQPMCVKLSQIYNLCHCPTVVPTVSMVYPCDGPCPGGCAGTQYSYASNTPTCSATASY